jgi:hypothetical protein
MRLLILSFILVSNIYAYKDMSKVSKRANDLNMRTKDYTFAMAIAGTFSGAIFGLFLWKVK